MLRPVQPIATLHSSSLSTSAQYNSIQFDTSVVTAQLAVLSPHKATQIDTKSPPIQMSSPNHGWVDVPAVELLYDA